MQLCNCWNYNVIYVMKVLAVVQLSVQLCNCRATVMYENVPSGRRYLLEQDSFWNRYGAPPAPPFESSQGRSQKFARERFKGGAGWGIPTKEKKIQRGRGGLN